MSYLCSRKLTNQVITLKTNLDYETYIISNRSGILNDDIRIRTETRQRPRRSHLDNGQDGAGIGTFKSTAQRYTQHQPKLSQRHPQLPRHRLIRMGMPQQGAEENAHSQTMAEIQGGLLLLSPDRMA